MLSNSAGSSAILKLLQVRPALLEKRIKRPSLDVSAAAAGVATGSLQVDAGNNDFTIVGVALKVVVKQQQHRFV
jgi:hypothetical protein